MSKPYLKKIIIFLFFILIFILSSSGCGLDDTEQIENKPQKKSYPKELYNNIEVSAEIQDIIGGKQKIVFYITNNNENFSFTGTIRVEIVSVDDRPLGLEYVYVDDLPPGGNIWVILWSKPGAFSFYSNIRDAEFREITASSNIPYEQIGVKGQTIYIYTSSEDLNELQQIITIYKNDRFKNVAIFQIYFFNDKEQAKDALDSKLFSYDHLVALIARYLYNSNTGADELWYDYEERAFEEYGEKKIPAIQIKIYEGPIYSETDNICYYRIEAVVTGAPIPVVVFSKDDSLGNLGKNRSQINLYSKDETLTLTATATNSEGSATDSIVISWGCSEN